MPVSTPLTVGRRATPSLRSWLAGTCCRCPDLRSACAKLSGCPLLPAWEGHSAAYPWRTRHKTLRSRVVREKSERERKKNEKTERPMILEKQNKTKKQKKTWAEIKDVLETHGLQLSHGWHFDRAYHGFYMTWWRIRTRYSVFRGTKSDSCGTQGTHVHVICTIYPPWSIVHETTPNDIYPYWGEPNVTAVGLMGCSCTCNTYYSIPHEIKYVGRPPVMNTDRYMKTLWWLASNLATYHSVGNARIVSDSYVRPWQYRRGRYVRASAHLHRWRSRSSTS